MLGAERIIENLGAARNLFSDGEYNISEMFSSAVNNISAVSEFSEELGELCSRAEEIYAETSALSRDISALAEELDFDPNELEKTEDRLGVINSLKKKIRAHDLRYKRISCGVKKEIESIEYSDRALEQLDAQLAQAHNELVDKAEKLSAARRSAADRFCKEVAAELSDLEMPKVRIEVRTDRKSIRPTAPTMLSFL